MQGTPIPFAEALRVWIRVAMLSFGGPAAQIAVMHRILVEEKRWLSENRFLHALNYCMLLPGPEAQQLATYSGWLLHGYRGGLTAGLLFILPGFVAILLLSVLYAGYGELPVVSALFFGLKAAVLAIVIDAVLRIGQRALHSNLHIGIAAAAFIGIFFLSLPFPAIIITAAIIGLVCRQTLQLQTDNTAVDTGGFGHGHADHATGWRRALTILAIFLPLWFTPIALLGLTLGPDNVYFQAGWFFSKAAVVTFGGAYAVLAYIAQQAVEVYGWLAPGEMLDGLGMAETTPGPLIQVVQFVGFMGAFRDAGALHPMLAGTLGALITTWVTFVPCFLWIFLGAPYVESLRGNQRLSAALSGITAAVVGVILNLAVWFAIHVLFTNVQEQSYGPFKLLIPDWASLEPMALFLSLGALIAMLRYRTGMLTTLASAAMIGLMYRLLFS